MNRFSVSSRVGAGVLLACCCCIGGNAADSVAVKPKGSNFTVSRIDTPAIKHGELLEYYIHIPGWPPWPGGIVYRDHPDDDSIPGGGSALSLVEIVGEQYPDGIDVSSLREILEIFYGRCDPYTQLVTERTRSRMIGLVKQFGGEKLEKPLYELLAPAQLEVMDNKWSYIHSSTNGRGGLSVGVARGTLSPFSITSEVSVPLLANGALRDLLDQVVLESAVKRRRSAIAAIKMMAWQ